MQCNGGNSAVFVISLIIFALFSSPSLATEVKESSAGIERILVTSQKRVQALNEVPISVSAMNDQKMGEAGLARLEDFSHYIPNFSVTKGAIADAINIRGIQSGAQAGFEQSVGTFVNGVYRGRGVQARFAFVDIERAEVLRGPQSILFGKNTVAGALNLASKRPEEAFYSKFAIAYTPEFQQTELEGMVTGSVSDSVRGRIFVLSRELDKGWINNIYYNDTQPKADELVSRTTIEWDISDYTTFTTIYEKGDVDNTLGFSMLAPGNTAAAGAIADGYTKANIGNVGVLDIGAAGIFKSDNTELTFISESEFKVGTLTIVAANSKYNFTRYHDADYNPLSAIRFDDTERFSQKSVEVRFTSNNSSKFEYLTGLYWQKQTLFTDGLAYFNTPLLQGVLDNACHLGIAALDGDYDEVITLGDAQKTAATLIASVPSAPAGLVNACGLAAAFYGAPKAGRYAMLEQQTNTLGIFAQGTWAITDNLKTTLGLRYTTEEKSAYQAVYASDLAFSHDTNQTQSPVVSAVAQAIGEFVPHRFTPSDTGMTREENSPTWLLNTQYDISDNIMAYASASTGFKAGGFNSFYMSSLVDDQKQAFPEDVSFEEEKVTAFEIGVKAMINSDIDVNIALFRTLFEDIQVSVFSGNTTFQVQNAAEATSSGLEIEGRWQATNDLFLSAALGLLDFEFDSFEQQACTSDQFIAQRQSVYAAALANNNVSDAIETALNYNNATCSNQGINDLTGRTNAHAPDVSLTLTASHFTELGNVELNSNFDLNYHSEVYRVADLDPLGLQPSKLLLNASVVLSPLNSNWTISLIAKNLTNEQYFNAINDVPLFAGAHSFLPEPGRSWTIKLNYTFE